MAPRGQPAKNLVEMRLGPPGLGVQPIQPIHDQNLQRRAPSFVTAVFHSRSSGRL